MSLREQVEKLSRQVTDYDATVTALKDMLHDCLHRVSELKESVKSLDLLECTLDHNNTTLDDVERRQGNVHDFIDTLCNYLGVEIHQVEVHDKDCHTGHQRKLVIVEKET